MYLLLGGDWNIMKLTKWITLSALFGFSVSFAQGAKDVRILDIVIRDFQPNHPDFENFSEEAVKHLDNIYNYRTGTGTLMQLNGYDLSWYNNAAKYHYSCGNMNTIALGAGAAIGADGLPMKPNYALPLYLQQVSTKDTLRYGECGDKYKDPKTQVELTQRGYKNAQNDVSGYKCPNGNTMWANPVIYTPGMVAPYLQFPKMTGGEGKYDMLNDVVIVKANDLCDNQYFEPWFADVPPVNGLYVNKRVNTTMDIPKDDKSNYFIYDYNYNNGGYSPLDSINPDTREWVMNKPCNPKIQPNQVCDQFDPQTLSIFCPPYDYEWRDKQADYRGNNTYKLCTDWLNYGGPRNVSAIDGSGYSAAWQAAVYNGSLGKQHLRNYAFTMMGYASFKYKQSNQSPMHEVFEFAGDDDMWIFVDGVLVVDLGGTHLSAPGKVDIEVLAKNNHGCHILADGTPEPLANYSNCAGASDAKGWADDTWHHLHFFYADRQSDGSNIYIRTSLAELAPSRYGQPSVGNVIVKVGEDGVPKNSMFMNVPLADSTVANMVNPINNAPSMLVLRDEVVLGLDGKPLKNSQGTDSMVTNVYGYYVSKMEGPVDKGADGQLYQFSGTLTDATGRVLEGGLLGNDRIAFNVKWSQGLEDDGNGGNYTADEWKQIMFWSKLMPFNVAASSGKNVEGFDEKDKWAKISYTAVAVVTVIPDDPAYDRPDFTNEAQKLSNLAEASEDGTLPTDMTADLVLTPIPATGIDPMKWAKDNAETITVSGPQGEVAAGSVVYGASQGTNSTLCYSNGSKKVPGKKSNESCTQWSFPTTQPFHVNIRVFDHLGHFVNQYTKRVTGDDFKNALMGQRAGSDAVGKTEPKCNDLPLYGETGALLATIKMYPVTDKGRLLATGPYVYQMTVVLEQFDYCYSNGSSTTPATMPFQRTTETIRRGYRRTVRK